MVVLTVDPQDKHFKKKPKESVDDHNDRSYYSWHVSGAPVAVEETAAYINVDSAESSSSAEEGRLWNGVS